MTTLIDLGVTTSKLRSYGQDGKFEALTGPQLQGICCYLKAHLDKKEGKFKRWGKEISKEMRGIGITQHQRTGEPCINYRKAKVVENISVSLEDFNRVEDELKAAQDRVKILEAQAIVSLIDPGVKEVYEELYSDGKKFEITEDAVHVTDDNEFPFDRVPEKTVTNLVNITEAEALKLEIDRAKSIQKDLGQRVDKPKPYGNDYWNVMDPDTTKPIPKRKRRTKAQIEADKNK